MSLNTYANLMFDGQSILLPQSELLHTEPAGSIRPHVQETADSSLGFVDYDQSHWPVYSLSAALSPHDKLPQQRQLVAFISSGENQLGLACDAATTLQVERDSIFEELPEIMRIQNSPVRALLFASGNMHYVSSAKGLINYLLSKEDQE